MVDGHEILRVFSFPLDGVFMSHARLSMHCEQHNIPFQIEKVGESDISALIEQGCDLIVCAGYLYKVPPLNEEKIRGINCHPTYLPHGRGVMPLPKILLDYPEHAGVTVHKLAPDYDMGDILMQQKIDVMADEDIETLSAKIAMRMPDMISDAVTNLDAYWSNAAPQSADDGSWFEPFGEDDMTLDFTAGVDAVNARARAFGRYGMIAHIQGQKLAVFNMKAWHEEHDHQPGFIVCIQSREIVITLSDGYVILKEFQKIEG